MWERILEIVKKEVFQVLRHRRQRVVLFVPPMIQLIIYGFAVNLDVNRINTAWIDLDQSQESRELLSSFRGSKRFFITETPVTQQEAQALLNKGQVQAVVQVMPNFARDIYREIPTSVQVVVDGTNSNTAMLISTYASEIIAGYEADAVRKQQFRRTAAMASVGSARAPRLSAQTRVWFNPELKSRNYFIPGVIVNMMMVVTVMLTAMAIVREKEAGTLEQLMVTPIRPIELMIGKTIPFAFVGLVDVILVVSLAILVFDVPLRGNIALLMFCALLFLMTSLGVGLFISTICRTQQQALMSAFFFATPTFMLSGFAFPIRNMPEPVQYLTYFNPLRYFMEIVRGIFLKGLSVDVLWPNMVVLAIYGVLILSLSAMRFKKRLE